MYYPALNKLQSRSVSIPDMSGGVNLADAVNLVEDNQMTDCKNLWYKDGVLKTRPAVKVATSFDGEALMGLVTCYSVQIEQYINGDKPTLFIVKEELAELGRLIVYFCFEEASDKNFYITHEFEDLPESEMFYAGPSVKNNGVGIYMVAYNKLSSYCGEELVAERKVAELYEICFDGTNYSLNQLAEDEYYSPVVLINGKGDSYSSLPVSVNTQYAPASLLEGHSVFHKAWHRYAFTTDGESTAYTLPEELVYCELKVQYTNYKTGKTYISDTLTIRNIQEGSTTGALGADYIVKVLAGEKIVNIMPKTNKPNLPSSLNALANNLIISVRWFMPEDITAEEKENFSVGIENTPLFGMKNSTWFGGAADGISGGTRLFVSGSEDKPSLIMWSDLNNPTYFSENNYVYIGEETQRITALKKQSDMLVIFKENELFYTTYTEGSTYTAEDVISGMVVDVTTQSAVFPMIQIHSEIGCDIPKSIQLCGDRLVWACSDKHIYMLKSANQYSKTNISKISAMIDRRLKTITKAELQQVKSCAYDGHYFLGLGNKIFVLNYDDYYFTTSPSYSDSRKIQRKLIWYLWELPGDESHILYSDFMANKNKLTMVWVYSWHPESGGAEYVTCQQFNFIDNIDSDSYLEPMYTENSSDFAYLIEKSAPITSIMQTKLFDFGMPARFKKIEQAYIGLGKEEGYTFVEYITDRGNLGGGVIDIAKESEETDPTFVTVKRLLPSVNRALRFGIRLECKGRLAVDSISINYKPMGVTR